MNFLKTLKTILLLFTVLLSFSCEEDDISSEKKCSGLSFEAEIIENQDSKNVEYKFEASEIIEEDAVVVYEWKINGESIATGTPNEPKRILNYIFERNGSFEVCVFVETPNCPNGVRICKNIKIEGLEKGEPGSVETKCDDLSFDLERVENQNSKNIEYKFEASEIIEDNAVVGYEWSIDGEFFVLAKANQSNRIINYAFEKNGSFEVCVHTETPDCPKGVKTCKTLKIEDL